MEFNLQLTEEEARWLEDLAIVTGSSKQSVITELIRREWKQHQAQHNAGRELNDISSHRAGLMRRLRDA